MNRPCTHCDLHYTLFLLPSYLPSFSNVDNDTTLLVALGLTVYGRLDIGYLEGRVNWNLKLSRLHPTSYQLQVFSLALGGDHSNLFGNMPYRSPEKSPKQSPTGQSRDKGTTRIQDIQPFMRRIHCRCIKDHVEFLVFGKKFLAWIFLAAIQDLICSKGLDTGDILRTADGRDMFGAQTFGDPHSRTPYTSACSQNKDSLAFLQAPTTSKCFQCCRTFCGGGGCHSKGHLFWFEGTFLMWHHQVFRKGTLDGLGFVLQMSKNGITHFQILNILSYLLDCTGVMPTQIETFFRCCMKNPRKRSVPHQFIETCINGC
mmetsp:Transcript_26117/g.60663  ORF Transcript_26117/g.60663 Transcript_26117/m.60663 type:complete len:315 (+) Transcript_26117:1894-2838(+)